MIKCGHCGRSHGTVAEVRKCSQSGIQEARNASPASDAAFMDADEREMQRMEAEADRAQTYREERDKARFKAETERWSPADRERAQFQRQMRNTEPRLVPRSVYSRNGEPSDLTDLLKQVEGMLTTRIVPEEWKRWAEQVRALIYGERGIVTEYALRSAIGTLETFAVKRTDSKAVEREGLYRLSRSVTVEGVTYDKGTLFQVVRNQQATHLYAKMVTFNEPVDGKNVRPTLDYVRGMVFNLRDDELLPLEVAEEITRKTGWCVFGHFLTSPVSIARGMGPKCYERYPHLARNAA